MCTRAFTHHLRCSHRSFLGVDSRCCPWYQQQDNFCPRNHDKIKHRHTICSDCLAQLHKASWNLNFKIKHYGDDYSSCSSSGTSTPGNDSITATNLPVVPLLMENWGLGPIFEEEEEHKSTIIAEFGRTTLARDMPWQFPCKVESETLRSRVFESTSHIQALGC
jgi:hypothetical protein